MMGILDRCWSAAERLLLRVEQLHTGHQSDRRSCQSERIPSHSLPSHLRRVSETAVRAGQTVRRPTT